MKYIFIFILVYWVLRRVVRIFAVVGSDQGGSSNTQTNYSPPKQNSSSSDSQKGEYIDFEEIE